MDPIASFSGLASGIQWQDMVDQIMKLEAARTVDPLKNRVTTQNARIDAWKAYQGLVDKLKSASLALRDGASFGLYNATAGTTAAGRGLISATASASASPGSYRVEVIELARAEKLSGRNEASTTTALGFSGQFLVNGRAVTVAATDTLNDVRDRINAVNSGSTASGVTATVLTTGTNAHRLILTADQTGSRGIELVDSASGGGVLQQLGILDGTLTANRSATDSSRVESQRFNSKTTQLATILGVSPMPSETRITINNQSITVNLATDTLMDVMIKVQALAPAEILTETVGGRTQHRLSIAGTVAVDATAPNPADSQRVLELLGLQRSGRPGEITAGSDSVAVIDGFRISRRTNMVTDAITGVSINLLTADTTGRSASTTDADLAIVNDPKSIAPGSYAVNFGATTTRGATASGVGLAVTTQAGVTSGTIADGTYGVELTGTTTRTSSADANLSVLNAPTGTVAADVYALEATVTRSQSSTNGALNATTAGSTVAAGAYTAELTTSRAVSDDLADLTVTTAGSSVAAGPIAINITQAAAVAATGTTTAFNSSLYSTNDTIQIVNNLTGVPTTVTLNKNETLTTLVGKLNTAFGTGGLTAVDNGGKLEIRGSTYGSAASFTITTSAQRVTDATGIGGTAGVTYAGKDVVATSAQGLLTGSGQTLTGATGGALDGLSMQYTGTAPTSGTVTITDTATGTINGVSATWDGGAKTLTSADGLVLSYANGTPTGALGSQVVTGLGTVTITDTIVGTATGSSSGTLAGSWDAPTQTFVATNGLEVQYTGTLGAGTLGSPTVSSLGNVTVADAFEITGGTIGGEASTWDAGTQTLAANAGTALEGLAVAYGGPALAGAVGSVDVVTTTTLNGVSIDGEAADWDSATGTIRGRAGSRFEGLEMTYAGPASYTGGEQSGYAGDLVITGDVAVDLTISRDTAGTAEAITAYADAYNAVRSFVSRQQSSGDVLGTDGTLRSTTRGLTEVLLQDMEALAGTGFSRSANAGVALDRNGVLQVDAAALTAALESSANDVKALFGEVGREMYEATDAIAAAFGGTVASQIRFLEESNLALEGRVLDAESRLEVQRQGMLRQYAQMETMISQIQSQGNWLSQQISSLQPQS